MMNHLRGLSDKYRSPLLILVMLLCAAVAQAQYLQPIPNYGYQWNRGNFTVLWAPPQDTFPVPVSLQHIGWYAIKNKVPYQFNTVTKYWEAIGNPDPRFWNPYNQDDTLTADVYVTTGEYGLNFEGNINGMARNTYLGPYGFRNQFSNWEKYRFGYLEANYNNFYYQLLRTEASGMPVRGILINAQVDGININNSNKFGDLVQFGNGYHTNTQEVQPYWSALARTNRIGSWDRMMLMDSAFIYIGVRPYTTGTTANPIGDKYDTLGHRFHTGYAGASNSTADSVWVKDAVTGEYQLRAQGDIGGTSTTTLSTLTYGATTTWNFTTQGPEAKVTLTGNSTLSIANLPAGKVVYLTLEVIQDATGSRTLTLPAGTKVINGGAGAITLTTTGGATDLITFRWNGTTLYANYGPNYN